jgi:hypothetical protein
MFDPESLGTVGEMLNRLSAMLAQKYVNGAEPEWTEYLNSLLTTSKAIIKFAMEVGPVWKPGTTPIQAAGFVAAWLLESGKNLAREAKLDPHNAEALVLAVQRAVQEGVDEVRGYAGNIWPTPDAH